MLGGVYTAALLLLMRGACWGLAGTYVPDVVTFPTALCGQGGREGGRAEDFKSIIVRSMMHVYSNIVRT